MPSGIYAIKNEVNGKAYVGSAVCFSDRLGQHRRALSKGAHSNAKLQRAWDKYGAGAFTFKRLLKCSREMLLFYEQRAIDIFDSVKKGYNVAAIAGNSMLGLTHSVETRAKISASHKGKTKTRTPEHQANLTSALRARGLSLTPEQRAKLSKVRKGIPLTEEHKAKISKAHKGKRQVIAPETRAKISAANKGRVKTEEHQRKIAEANRGKKRTPEQCARMSETSKAFYEGKRIAKQKKT